MFEQNRYKNLYVTTLNVTGKIFVYYEIDKSYWAMYVLHSLRGMPQVSTTERSTNADLKISLYILNHVKVIQWKFRNPNRKNSRVIYP